MIQLGPEGLYRGLKRIKNLLVEEISLVDKAAINREFLLIKRYLADRSPQLEENVQRRHGSMGLDFKELGNLGEGEYMVFEKEEELALPPDFARQLKLAIGILTKLLGYKVKAKYRFAKPGKGDDKDADDVDQAKKKPDEDEDEPDEDEDEDKKKKKVKTHTIDTPGGKLIDQELPKDLNEALEKIGKLVEEPDFDVKKVQGLVDGALEKLKASGGDEQ